MFCILLPSVSGPLAANPCGRFSKFLYQKVGITKLVPSAQFRGKVLSLSGVDMLLPRSSQDLKNHIWYKLETSISTS